VGDFPAPGYVKRMKAIRWQKSLIVAGNGVQNAGIRLMVGELLDGCQRLKKYLRWVIWWLPFLTMIELLEQRLSLIELEGLSPRLFKGVDYQGVFVDGIFLGKKRGVIILI